MTSIIRFSWAGLVSNHPCHNRDARPNWRARRAMQPALPMKQPACICTWAMLPLVTCAGPTSNITKSRVPWLNWVANKVNTPLIYQWQLAGFAWPRIQDTWPQVQCPILWHNPWFGTNSLWKFGWKHKMHKMSKDAPMCLFYYIQHLGRFTKVPAFWPIKTRRVVFVSNAWKVSQGGFSPNSCILVIFTQLNSNILRMFAKSPPKGWLKLCDVAWKTTLSTGATQILQPTTVMGPQSSSIFQWEFQHPKMELLYQIPGRTWGYLYIYPLTSPHKN